MAKNTHILLTRAKQHIQEINRHFYGTLNHYGPIDFAENQQQNESYTFKITLLQPDMSDLILATVKEVKSNESISHWKLMKKIEVNNKHKNKYGKFKIILSIWSFKWKGLLDGRLMRQKSRICSHGGMKKWGVNY